MLHQSVPFTTAVIAGATSPEQMGGNAAAAGWELTDEELNEVDSIVTSPD
jgi:aryl-alcohol dehydrogenase-like predicted oxidoreductase